MIVKDMFEFLKLERKTIEKYIQTKGTTKDDDKLNKKVRKEISNSAKVENVTSVQYNNNCLIHPSSNHLTRKCKKFLSMSIKDRLEVVQNAGGCMFCLSVSHKGRDCPRMDSWGPCGVNDCTEYHSRLLHTKFSGQRSRIFQYINSILR